MLSQSYVGGLCWVVCYNTLVPSLTECHSHTQHHHSHTWRACAGSWATTTTAVCLGVGTTLSTTPPLHPTSRCDARVEEIWLMRMHVILAWHLIDKDACHFSLTPHGRGQGAHAMYLMASDFFNVNVCCHSCVCVCVCVCVFVCVSVCVSVCVLIGGMPLV